MPTFRLLLACLGLSLLPGCVTGPAGKAADPVFSEPSRADVQRTGRTVEVSLTAETRRLELAGRSVEVLTYNGQYPGPTVEVREGDRLVVHLRNLLAEPTNLHWHGIPVPVDQDAAMEVVAPGATRDFAFDLPVGSAGTYWYHPHVHGAVARQVARGLFGAVRVLPAEDPLPAAVGDALVVLSDLRVGAEGRAEVAAGLERANGFEGDTVLVNGRVAPSLGLRPGEARRLRLVNASSARYYRLATPGRPMQLVATDGGFIERPTAVDELLLTPGERAEVIVTAPTEAGTPFSVQALPYDRGTMSMAGGATDAHAGHGPKGKALPAPSGGMDHAAMGHGHASAVSGGMDHAAMGHGSTPAAPGASASPATAPIVLLALPVAGEPAAPLVLPATLRPVPALMPGPQSRLLTLSEDHMALDFRIDGRRFEMGRVDARARLGTTETWEIVNTGHMDHPFHLHGFNFQVLDRGGRPEPFRAWRDTVNVKAAERLRFAVRFDAHPGPRVYHCHILDHEDLGMMGVLEVAP